MGLEPQKASRLHRSQQKKDLLVAGVPDGTATWQSPFSELILFRRALGVRGIWRYGWWGMGRGVSFHSKQGAPRMKLTGPNSHCLRGKLGCH